MGVAAADSDTAGIGGAFVGAVSCGFVAAVGGMAGMMRTDAVSFRSHGGDAKGHHHCKDQHEADPGFENRFQHGFQVPPGDMD